MISEYVQKLNISKKKLKKYKNNNFINGKINYNKHNITLDLPKVLNIKELKDIIYKLKYLKSEKEKQRFFYYTLIFISVVIKRQKTLKMDNVNLCRRYMEKYIDKKYLTKIQKLLIREQIIVKSNSYRVRIFSKAYKVCGFSYTQKHYETEKYIITDMILVKKIIRTCEIIDELENENIIRIKENLKKLNLDEESVKNILEEYGDKEKLIHTNTIHTLNTSPEKLWFKEDRKTGRWYSQITNFPSKLRSFIRINGEEVCEIDIKNCQPLILAMLYPPNSPNHALVECEKYKDICLGNGDLYSYLNSKLEDPYTCRKELKKAVYKYIMYGNGYNHKLWIVFQYEFPYLAKVIKTRKNQLTARNFSLTMQKFESRLVIATVFDYCRKFIPEWDMIPIHDGLMVARSISEQVKKVFEDLFFETIGIRPVLVIK